MKVLGMDIDSYTYYGLIFTFLVFAVLAIGCNFT